MRSVFQPRETGLLVESDYKGMECRLEVVRHRMLTRDELRAMRFGFAYGGGTANISNQNMSREDMHKLLEQIRVIQQRPRMQG